MSASCGSRRSGWWMYEQGHGESQIVHIECRRSFKVMSACPDPRGHSSNFMIVSGSQRSEWLTYDRSHGESRFLVESRSGCTGCQGSFEVISACSDPKVHTSNGMTVSPGSQRNECLTRRWWDVIRGSSDNCVGRKGESTRIPESTALTSGTRLGWIDGQEELSYACHPGWS